MSGNKKLLMNKGTFFLLFSAIGVFSVILFDEITNNNLSNIFRLIIVLHFVLIIFWIAGAFLQALHIIALWSLFIFYTGIAASRFLSIIVNGIPESIIIFYFILEIVGSIISLWLLRSMNNKKRKI